MTEDHAVKNAEAPVANSTIKVEGATLHWLHAPGHTQDHTCWYLEEENALFAGDCILGAGTVVFEQLKQYVDSLMAMLSFWKSRSVFSGVIYPGHGPVVEDGFAKIQEYLDHRQARENQILQTLGDARRPLTIPEIVQVVYDGYSDELKQVAEISVLHHLDKLELENVVKPGQNGEWILLSRTKL